MADDEEDPGFSLDLTDLPDSPPEEGVIDPGTFEIGSHQLDDLLVAYGPDSVDKAYDLIAQHRIELAKREGDHAWYNVQGSRLYVVRTIRTPEEVVAECTCPNGARGSEGNCYHVIAAKVVESGLAPFWIPNWKPSWPAERETPEGAGVVTVGPEAFSQLMASEEPQPMERLKQPLRVSIMTEPRRKPKVEQIIVRNLGPDSTFTKQRVTFLSDGSITVANWLEVDAMPGETPEEATPAFKGWSNPVKLTVDEWDWEAPDD